MALAILAGSGKPARPSSAWPAAAQARTPGPSAQRSAERAHTPAALHPRASLHPRAAQQPPAAPRPHATQPYATQRRATQPPLRLTSRGRLVLVVFPLFVAALAALVAWSALTAPAKAAERVDGPGPVATVTVQPGQSLWTIAADRVPDQDPRVTVSQIRELNDLAGTRVLPGEQILVPLGR
jgi:hypothetical protein